MLTKTFFRASAIAALAIAAPPLAADAALARDASAEQAAFAADRADILAMAGDYKVRFDMRETTPWAADYEPLEAKISGGHESVRVIEDTGDRIVLQHLLVVEHGGETHVIKHWRQDWEYEPEHILAYGGSGSWTLQRVPEQERDGVWSQTVYQVDDSPRYAGWGEWETVGGVRRWSSNRTMRPLARRDAVRDPVYGHYLAINRHSPTPDGWIHWQDNLKVAEKDGELVPIVQESVLNSYVRFDDYPVSAADAYWAATRDYWAAVRAKWDEVAGEHSGVAIEEEANTGTVISGRLLTLASEIEAGRMAEADAIEEATGLIEAHAGGA